MDMKSIMPGPITLRALLLGQRLETRGLEDDGAIAQLPLTLRVGDQGIAFVFRYGVAVLAGVSATEEDVFLRSLRSRIIDALATPEIEQVSIVVKPDSEDQIEASGVIALKEASSDRLQLIANVMSKNVVLALHELQMAAAFDRIEPLAAGLKRRGRGGREARQLIRQIGDILLTQHRMVGRVAVEDKPDVL